MNQKLKRTTEEVRTYFAEFGYELLGEYEGVIKPIECRCSCGKISKISWNNFSRGRRCAYCHPTGRKKKYTLEEVSKVFEEHGCKLLATEYQSNIEPLDCVCKCGRPWKASVNVILNQNQYCQECGRESARKKLTKPGSKKYRELYYKYRKSIRRTLAALNMKKLDYSHKLLGYTAKDLQNHIINHPNWNNVKDTEWHLDHIFPVKAFVDHGITDIKLINCLDNLQPLSQKENNQKCDNYDKQAFEVWLQAKSLVTY